MMLTKGMRVRAEWLQADPIGSASLPGAQPKVTGKFRSVEGAVVHIRGNNSVSPSTVGVWIDTEDGIIVVNSEYIVSAWRN